MESVFWYRLSSLTVSFVNKNCSSSLVQGQSLRMDQMSKSNYFFQIVLFFWNDFNATIDIMKESGYSALNLALVLNKWIHGAACVHKDDWWKINSYLVEWYSPQISADSHSRDPLRATSQRDGDHADIETPSSQQSNEAQTKNDPVFLPPTNTSLLVDTEYIHLKQTLGWAVYLHSL